VKQNGVTLQLLSPRGVYFVSVTVTWKMAKGVIKVLNRRVNYLLLL